MTGGGAAFGALWGFLFGLIFFVPLLGMAIGAGMGALGGSLADFGIDDDFIKQVRERVTPGTSALFALTSEATVDRVIEELKQFDFEIISRPTFLRSRSRCYVRPSERSPTACRRS